ncbi:hypothetical protein JCM19297_570 [Nonlabens ulvanivorans]|nr:hypothetical protein [Nonlabens ulvanivorans]GAK89948.1 hypothetical protein JCM19297_570 [Nonlabens ulvanivorans]
MKNKLLFVFALVATFNFGFSQEEENDLHEVPYDFLDLFDESRRDQEMVMTNTKLYIGFGFNQALGDGNGIGDDYRFWGGSGVFDLGLEFSTRLKKEDDFMRFNYGLTMRIQSLRINDDKVFSTFNNVTRLEDAGFDLDGSRFTQVSILAPVHLEFGRRDLKDYEDGIRRYGGTKPFVVGVGGYLGLVSTSSQEIKYEREGRDVTNTLTNDFEVNNFQYGLSVYAGWNDAQLFATYGLNDIFKDSPVQQQYVTLGVRFR